MSSEERINRDRNQRLRDQIASLSRKPPDGARSLLVTTTTVDTYPTTATSFFAVFATGVTGTELEGSAPTFTQETDVFYVLNLGSAIPPVGTIMLAEMAGGLWCVRYDG